MADRGGGGAIMRISLAISLLLFATPCFAGQPIVPGPGFHVPAGTPHGTLVVSPYYGTTLTGTGMTCGSQVGGTDVNVAPIVTVTCSASASLTFSELIAGSAGSSDDDTSAPGGLSSVSINGTVVARAQGAYTSSPTNVYTGGLYTGGADPNGYGGGGGGAGNSANGSDATNSRGGAGGIYYGGAGGDYDSDGNPGNNGAAGGGGGGSSATQVAGGGGNVVWNPSGSISSGTNNLVIVVGKGCVGVTTGGAGSVYLLW